MPKVKVAFIIDPIASPSGLRRPGNLADAIVKLVNNPGLKLKMGRESHERVKLLFDFEKAVKDYESLYLKLES